MNDEAQWVGPLQPAPTVCDQCGKPLDDHPLLCPGAGPRCVVPPDAPRAPKWQRVEPGTVIPAGQPYRVEHHMGSPVAQEFIWIKSETTLDLPDRDYFVDSSWRPPLDSAWDLLSQAVDEFENNLSIGETPAEALRLRDCVRGLLNLRDREAGR
jgi:hypothetical protein